MALIFRQIRNRPAWEAPEAGTWIPDGDASADILKSFETDDSILSIYLVENDNAQIERLIGAFCANRSKVQTLDYVLIPEANVNDLGLVLENVAGDVPDVEVCDWHRNVVHLSVRRLSELALRSQSQGEVKRLLDKPVGILINRLINEGRLSPTALKADLLLDLAKSKYQP